MFIDIVEGEIVSRALSPADHKSATEYHFASAEEVRGQDKMIHLQVARHHQGSELKPDEHRWAMNYHNGQIDWLKKNLPGRDGNTWRDFHKKLAAYHRAFI